ncbi:MAG: fibronectin type III domain-containing protein, partial [Aeromicrobium sp.]
MRIYSHHCLENRRGDLLQEDIPAKRSPNRVPLRSVPIGLMVALLAGLMFAAAPAQATTFVNNTAPTISGEAKVGALIQYDQNATWTPTPTSTTYEWLYDGVVDTAAGPNGTTTIPASHLGQKISVRITVSGTGANPNTVVTNELGPIAKGDIVFTTPPTIQGNAQVGSELRAGIPGLSPPGAYHGYNRWLADGVVIDGASGFTYTPSVADVGKKLSFRVTQMRDGFNDGVATSAETAAVTSSAPLTTPTNLHVEARTTTTLTLSWNAVPGAPKYRVRYSSHSDMDDFHSAVFSTNSGVITGLSKDHRYYFRVAVVASNGSTRLTPYTPSPYPSAKTALYQFAAPTNLRSTARTTTSLTLAWNAVTGAPRYKIQISRHSDMDDPRTIVVSST